MKKIVLLLCVVFALAGAKAQSIEYSLAYNTTTGLYEVYFTPQGFGGSSINIGPSQATILFEPPFAVSQTTIETTPVAGGPWTDQDFIVGTDGNTYVGFQTTGAPTSITNGQRTLLFTFNITSGDCGGRLRLWVNGTDPADPTGVSGGDFTSYINVGAGFYISTNSNTAFRTCTDLTILPVRFLDFAARKRGTQALLSWSVSGESAVSSHYELQRSLNGIDFSLISRVDARKQNQIENYQSADDISQLRAGKIFYRVKQVDGDGRSVYSQLGIVNPDSKSGKSELFPNPAREGFTLTFNWGSQSDKKVELHLANHLGQVLVRKDISAELSSYYFDFGQTSVSTGEYLLNIYLDKKLVESKKVIVQK
jgi:hypothetical protein